jgi:hypothetical protein
MWLQIWLSTAFNNVIMYFHDRKGTQELPIHSFPDVN